MKRIFTILAASLLFTGVFAQSPNKMSYQAVLRNASNALVVNTSVGMKISVLQGSSSGNAVYIEKHIPTTNANGLVSIEIGGGTFVNGNFSDINWANGPYFVKTETDITGGINYSISSVSQLLSVPYALYAEKSGTPGPKGDKGEKGDAGIQGLKGDKGEKGDAGIQGLKGDTGSQGLKGDKGDQGAQGVAGEKGEKGDAGIQGLKGDAGSLGLKGEKGDKGEQGIQGIAGTNGQGGVTTAGNNINVTGSGTIASPYIVSSKDEQQLSVSASGDTLHLQNGGFVIIPGLSAANAPAPIYPVGSVFCSSGATAIVDVTNPTTGKTWMDRNLGASQAATSSTDAASYGDLYQWGRGSDGHQCRTSATTASLSSVDKPAHGHFILAMNNPRDWRSPQNTNLWQGLKGVNNPCPSGYRLPTEQEMEAERLSWSSKNAAGAFASPLKLPMAGYRVLDDGSLNTLGLHGYYWSSSVSGNESQDLDFTISNDEIYANLRAFGFSVRCIKD